MKKQTNWYVVTGGPGCGKTTTVNILKSRGFQTTIEYARHYIDTQMVTGKTVDEIRSNQKIFQSEILNLQIQQEVSLDPQETIFLDRAIPDALAYYRFMHIQEDDTLVKA